MSALRDRMIRDMTLRGFSPRTLAEAGAFATRLAQLQQQEWVSCTPSAPSPAPPKCSTTSATTPIALPSPTSGSSGSPTAVSASGWRDYADGARLKIMDLAAEQFLRRFLLHVVSERFVRFRHFGFLANRVRRATLARCRALLHHEPAPQPSTPESVPALLLRLTGLDIERCAVCGHGRICRVELLPPTLARRPRPVPAWATS